MKSLEVLFKTLRNGEIIVIFNSANSLGTADVISHREDTQLTLPPGFKMLFLQMKAAEFYTNIVKLEHDSQNKRIDLISSCRFTDNNAE